MLGCSVLLPYGRTSGLPLPAWGLVAGGGEALQTQPFAAGLACWRAETRAALSSAPLSITQYQPAQTAQQQQQQQRQKNMEAHFKLFGH
jgi:hypothetical protein